MARASGNAALSQARRRQLFNRLPLVAAVLGCSVGSVKQHAFRGLRALRSDSNLTYGELFTWGGM